ncbi:MAG TPA: oligosaccharide flippase family protein [Patescibacteria group bacterium]
MSRLKNIFGTATFRQSSLVSSATIINGILGLAFYITTARFLGPSLFGVLGLGIAIATAVSDISDFGINAGIVRFVGKYSNKPLVANKYLKISLKIKGVVAFSVLILGFIIAPFLATNIFGKPELLLPIEIAFVGVGFTLLYGFTTSALQALQKFKEWSVIQIGTNLLRLVLIFLLFSAGALGLVNSMLIYILMPLAGFVFGLLLLRERFWEAKGEKGKLKELIHFNKWVAAFIFVSAISSRLDTFISARLLTSDGLGIYSAATQLTQIVPQIAGALGTVIAPKMASMTDINKLAKYYKKVQVMVVGIAGLGLIGIPIASFVIPYLYGNKYEGAILIFVLLFIASLIFLISIPIHNAIIYYFSYPKLFLWLSIGHFLIIFFVGWNLISTYGAIGAAFSVLIGSLFNFVVPLGWLVNKIYRNEEKK